MGSDHLMMSARKLVSIGLNPSFCSAQEPGLYDKYTSFYDGKTFVMRSVRSEFLRPVVCIAIQRTPSMFLSCFFFPQFLAFANMYFGKNAGFKIFIYRTDLVFAAIDSLRSQVAIRVKTQPRTINICAVGTKKSMALSISFSQATTGDHTRMKSQEK